LFNLFDLDKVSEHEVPVKCAEVKVGSGVPRTGLPEMWH